MVPGRETRGVIIYARKTRRHLISAFQRSDGGDADQLGHLSYLTLLILLACSKVCACVRSVFYEIPSPSSPRVTPIARPPAPNRSWSHARKRTAPFPTKFSTWRQVGYLSWPSPHPYSPLLLLLLMLLSLQLLTWNPHGRPIADYAPIP